MGEDGINVVGRLPVLFSEKCFHDVLWSYMIYFSSVKELWLVYMFFVLFFSCVLVLWRTALKLRVESCRKKVIESKRAWKIELWCLFRLHPRYIVSRLANRENERKEREEEEKDRREEGIHIHASPDWNDMWMDIDIYTFLLHLCMFKHPRALMCVCMCVWITYTCIKACVVIYLYAHAV